MKKILLILCCLSFFSFVNCGKSKYDLTIELEDPRTTKGHYTAYAKIVAQGADESAETIYTGSGSYIGNKAIIIIDDIEENTYTLHTFIDTTDTYSNQVEAGDRAANGLDFTMDDNKTILVNKGWSAYSKKK